MRLGRRPFLRRVGWRSLARVGTLGLLLYSGRGCWFDLARLYISLRHRYLHHFTYCRLASNGSASPSDMSMRPLRGVVRSLPNPKDGNQFHRLLAGRLPPKWAWVCEVRHQNCPTLSVLP